MIAIKLHIIFITTHPIYCSSIKGPIFTQLIFSIAASLHLAQSYSSLLELILPTLLELSSNSASNQFYQAPSCSLNMSSDISLISLFEY